MSVQTIPDIEKLIRGYLGDHEDLDVRVTGQPPGETNAAWVQVVQLNAQNDPSSPVEHLIAYMVQLDCYASKAGIDGSQQKEATVLASTVRAALVDMPGVHDDVVVSSVRIVGDARIPDTTDEPARERRALTAIVHAHR